MMMLVGMAAEIATIIPNLRSGHDSYIGVRPSALCYTVLFSVLVSARSWLQEVPVARSGISL
jgi:hypothetical protein